MADVEIKLQASEALPPHTAISFTFRLPAYLGNSPQQLPVGYEVGLAQTIFSAQWWETETVDAATVSLPLPSDH